MRRPASIGLAAILLLSSVPHEAAAQAIRATKFPVNPSGPFIGLPAALSSPLLNSGLPASSPFLSLSVPLLPAPSLSLPPAVANAVSAAAAAAVTPKANPAAVKAVSVPLLNAVKAAKPQPPQAAPRMEAPSASALFDGAAVRSAASTGDPVVPDGSPEARVPRRAEAPPPVASRLARWAGVAGLPPSSHGVARVPLSASPLHAEAEHGHGSSPSGARAPVHESALKRAMAAALFFIAIEMIGGIVTGNAALQADSLHLASDQVINAAALFSAWLSRRPPSAARPNGFRKAEAVVGLLAAAVIAFTGFEMGAEAWTRFFTPGAAATWSVALFALASLGANLSSALILRRHHGESLGVKSAFMVAMTDTVGSIGVIVSAAAAILFGWAWVEPVVVALIGLMIVRIAWGLGRPAWKALVAPGRPASGPAR
ncbi:MAG: cation diffusion facilitator family transporter [Elusimicrobia bacterium]|nr:cation diffusion facilitator family transporter [Elusimicrobiota bacterium]